MSPIILAVIGISAIFLCTSLGSAFVFFFKGRPISERVTQIFLGFASGIMLSASFFSLILPSLESPQNGPIPNYAIAAISILLGAAFLWGIDHLLPHLHKNGKEEGLHASKMSKTNKMLLAVTIHNVPEGLSVGIAYGVALSMGQATQESAVMGALMLAIGIGIQNIPEGSVVSLSFKGEGETTAKSFWLGVLSGAVEPVAAVIGLFLSMQIQAIMPYALSFAAGCMIYVIVEEMIPDMNGDSVHHHALWAFLVGFVLMMTLDIALG